MLVDVATGVTRDFCTNIDNQRQYHTLNMVSDMVKLTFTVDLFTANAIRDSAEQWGVPKSEVVRKVVRQAKERLLLEAAARTPTAALERMAEGPLLSDAQRQTRLATVRRLRKDWSRRQRPGRQ